MRMLITGGAGFLGTALARVLLAGDAPIDALILADRMAPSDAAIIGDARVRVVTGELIGSLPDALASRPETIFHLAAAVSGECEADFDLGMRANLDSTRALLDGCRQLTQPPRVVFSSSLAVYGGDMPDVIGDDTLPMPQNSYGIQKFVCEQLIADYTRKGYIDGRSVRLPTVSVRPGAPNRAASSFISGIVREPLAGQRAVCPVDPSLGVWITSPRHAVAGLLAASRIDRATWGIPIAVNLPGLSVRIAEMIDALARSAGPTVAARVVIEQDETIARIVGGWPWRFHTARAERLGFTAPVSIDALIREYMSDHPEAKGKT